MMKKETVIRVSTLVLGSLFLLFMSNSVGASMKKINLTLASDSFKNGQAIPQKYTCDGQDISPQLHWQISGEEAPKGYVLIVDDPDAQRVVGKTFVHWIALLPSNVTELPEGSSSKQTPQLPMGRSLQNDFGASYYRGACPPASSGEHTYRFTLFAIQDDINKAAIPRAPFTAETFRNNFQGILAEAQLTGTYKRK
jgi:Raf kinase inhibitor-like YbhB/YbcL family protein